MQHYQSCCLLRLTPNSMFACKCTQHLSSLRLICLQRTKHHAAVLPAVSSSSQNSSFTALQHTHSNAAAERDAEEVTSKLSQHSSTTAAGNLVLQHSRSNAASEPDAAYSQAHAHPMQVQTLPHTHTAHTHTHTGNISMSY